ncbi:MAG: glycosyltransferase family 9 protein [Candidatus Omnitrophica bacterium]|nr:glycosyltransferase family 9 protein [Candidatus Omnitrophota bacterium]
MKLDPRTINRILLITLSNIGDAVLTTPVLHALHVAFPDSRVDILINPALKDMFEEDPRVAKIFFYDKHADLFEKYRILKKLHNLRYDLIVDLKNTMIPFFLQPRYRTPFLRQDSTVRHKKDEHLMRLACLGAGPGNAGLGIVTGLRDEERSRDILDGFTGGQKYIVLNPGAKSHVKRWPVEHFAALADRIVDQLHLNVVVVGKDDGRKNPDSDRVIADRFLAIAKKPVLDLVGKTNVRELACIIRMAKAIVTNDSAPLHIASAVGTPTVALFGPTDERKYGPLAPRSVVLRGVIPCAPCEKAQCDRRYDCLTQISVQDAFNAVKKICASL